MGEVDEQEVMVMVEWVEIAVSYFKQVVDFIKKHGLKGPEGTYPKEGQYIQVPKFTKIKKKSFTQADTRINQRIQLYSDYLLDGPGTCLIPPWLCDAL